jgi:heme-degrading monooxygenase HmoA
MVFCSCRRKSAAPARSSAEQQVSRVIVRMWKGEAKAGMAGNYRRHIEDTVFPRLRELPGFIGAQLLNRERNGRTEVVVLTRWHSMDAVRRFAGNSPERAVVEPKARDALSSFDDPVTHYELDLEA